MPCQGNSGRLPVVPSRVFVGAWTIILRKGESAVSAAELVVVGKTDFVLEVEDYSGVMGDFLEGIGVESGAEV